MSSQPHSLSSNQPNPTNPSNNKLRLNKFLAERLGISRREADELIDGGKVFVDDEPAIIGAKIDKSNKVCYNDKNIFGRGFFMKMCLDGAWKAQGFAPDGKTLSFTGAVPGCVHTDLLREGVIEDPFFRKNSETCRWIEEWNWTYEKTFTLHEDVKDAYFEFEGLDTYARVFLNGSEIGESENMFIPHTFPARFRA